MNYLAHIYLSGDSDEIKLGNFIGDYVKGNKYRDYPEMVSYGIRILGRNFKTWIKIAFSDRKYSSPDKHSVL